MRRFASKKCKFLGHIFNLWYNETQCEERMQGTDKAWKGRCEGLPKQDVPWGIKCRIVLEQVYIVFCFHGARQRWTESKAGRHKYEAFIQNQEKEGKLLFEDGQSGKVHMGKDEVTLSL